MLLMLSSTIRIEPHYSLMLIYVAIFIRLCFYKFLSLFLLTILLISLYLFSSNSLLSDFPFLFFTQFCLKSVNNLIGFLPSATLKTNKNIFLIKILISQFVHLLGLTNSSVLFFLRFERA